MGKIETRIQKPVLYREGILSCPTCGTSDLLALATDPITGPGSASVRWCKNGHVTVVENGHGQEVYRFEMIKKTVEVA